MYKIPLPKNITDSSRIFGWDKQQGFFQGHFLNDPQPVTVRVYVIRGIDLHPMDSGGKADPYLSVSLGSKTITDKDNYVSKQLNPTFGKFFEFHAKFPFDTILEVQVWDWDLLGSDDLIGETKIDLENRFYSKHRATCGLAGRFDVSGYNKWRDIHPPTFILAQMCKNAKISPPQYSVEHCTVKVGETSFSIRSNDSTVKRVKEYGLNFDSQEAIDKEALALCALHQWHMIPSAGYSLVPEHIETRPLFNPNKPGIEQGRLEMWIDIFPADKPINILPVDVKPREPVPYELRVIIWNTDEVVLEDDSFFSGDKMSDIYVKGWLTNAEESQSTDVHYRSLTGEGNFNWRFIFPFNYLEAEEKIVTLKKESLFSWDETINKIPARLDLQVWDADHFSKDDFLGSLTLNLNRFPRGAKTAKKCSLEMLSTDARVPQINLFKQKWTKGWWPLYIKEKCGTLLLQGKVEAELSIHSKDEIEKCPAGLGRQEPNALVMPNRPDSSFMWFLNPFKSMRYIIWHNYKWFILKIFLFLLLVIFLALFFYALPGVTIRKIMGV